MRTENELKLRDKETFFQQKNVVITGGNSGIGRALADRLSQLGAAVTVLDVSEPESEQEFTSMVIDVGDKENFSQTSDLKPDILIIAAGVTSQTNEPTSQEVKLMERVNVDGVENTLEAFEPLLTETSQIVYVGTDSPPKAEYKRTKEAGANIVRNFSESHSNIDVRVLLVGPVRTALFERGKPPEVIARIEREHGLYQPAEFAEEVIEALVNQKSGLQETRMYKATRS